MKIAECHLYEFALPLKQPLVVGEKECDLRYGYVVELKDDSGSVGFGEVAPLDGYSDESQGEVVGELLRLRRTLVGYEIPENLEELSGGFESWLSGYSLSASVRFGFESAVLLLIAKHRKKSLARLLSDDPRDNVSINALLSGNYDAIVSQAHSRLEAGYSTFKLKVGRGSTDDDIRLTRKVRELIGSGAALRLDANRQWTLGEYEQFALGVNETAIEYIEEPLTEVSLLQALVKGGQLLIPPALDETLRTMCPDELRDWRGVKAIVLKPTMLGLERSIRFARAAAQLGINPVFSSSYESSLGLTTIANVAAAFDIARTPIGLDTVGIFQDDLLSPSLSMQRGQVAIDELPDVAGVINRNCLSELADE